MNKFNIKNIRKNYLKNYFKNIKKALISYKKKELEIHSFIWIKEINKNLKTIKISKKISKVKKTFILRFTNNKIIKN